MINEAAEATVSTATIFVALLSEHVSLAIMAGMVLFYVLVKSAVVPNDADKKSAGAGDTDARNK